jgi:serine/threonine protein kinase
MSSAAERMRYVSYDIEKSEILGRGIFGVVYLGHSRAAARWPAGEVAVKVLSPAKTREEQARIISEIDIMASVKHPAVLSLFAWGCRTRTDDPDPYYVLVTRRLRKSLETVFGEQRKKGTSRTDLDATRKSIIAFGIAAGVAYLHSRPAPILHRDLKPANVLLDDNMEPVICDFGFSRYLDPEEQCARTLQLGTPIYMAPELWVSDDGYSFAVDVFAYGMILYELITGIHPFTGGKELTRAEIRAKIIQKGRPDFPPDTDIDWVEFIQNCWAQIPTDRPSFMGMMAIAETFMLEGCDEAAFNAYVAKVVAFSAASTPSPP